MVAQGPQDSWIGRTVSHYRVVEKLGRGGMGIVYKAEDLMLERPVALKVLPPGQEDEPARRRLLEEARAASVLDHPNVCAIYEAEETRDGSLFFAMGYCEGETLRSRITRGPAGLHEALELAAQIASGLAHAHERGIVHGDVKPENLILTAAGQVKIVDFGVALWHEGHQPASSGSAAGTAAYMSPEQLRGELVDHRSDLWSLGVVLYELLTGRLPFNGRTDRDYAAAVLSGELLPLARRRPDLPEAVGALVDRLLTRNRARRSQQAGPVARDLLALRGDRPEPYGPNTGAAPTVVLGALPWSPVERRAALEVHPRVGDVFVGRRDELAALARHLLAEGTGERPATGCAIVCAIQGMPGVGKSYLADRFALETADRFPGGHLRLVLDPKVPASPRVLLEELAARLELRGSDDLAARVGARLRRPRTLLHIENVDSPGTEVQVGFLIRELHGCRVLVTGRLHDLGLALGWRQVRMNAFDEETALAQLRGELGWIPSETEDADHRELVRSLGSLPLAVHLAAGHLRSGRSVTGFLRALRQRRLAMTPADRLELAVGVVDEARKVLATSFAISLDLLREEIGPEAGRILPGLHALGHGPLTGFGHGLGAALAGLADDDFEELIFHAQKLGLLLPIPRDERPEGAWRLHSLLAELLGSGADSATVLDRATSWFVDRLPAGAPGGEADQGRRWREIGAENTALAWWLARVPAADRDRVQKAGAWYAVFSGPYHVWIEFCEQALRETVEPRQRLELFWLLCHVCLRHGRLDHALAAAREKLAIDQRLGDEHEESIAWELIADVLQARGDLDDSVEIRQKHQIPLHERLGKDRERSIALAKIGYVLKLRGAHGEALRILREALPALEQAGDVRSRAVILGMIADTLEVQGDLEEALRLRQAEELPIYQMLGEVRATAITIGKIAGILQTRGDSETALKMRQEQERPIHERSGDTRELALCLGRIADSLRSLGQVDEAIRLRSREQLPLLQQLGVAYELLFAQESLARLLLDRDGTGDSEEAVRLLVEAREAAARLRLPEEERMRSLLAEVALVESR